MRVIAILFCSCILWSNFLVALDIEVNQQRGFYEGPFNVIIDVNEPNSAIRYTINGIKPTTVSGTLYSNTITINTTSTLSIIAYNATDTVEIAHSYIFLSEILSAPYMSDHIIKNQTYIPLLNSAFTAIPSIAVTIPGGLMVEDAIEPDELQASVEMIFPDGNEPGFHISCGIKTWGGSPSNPKKNYRLVFKKIFGKGKLKYDVFDDSYNYPIEPVKQFDNLLLRAGSQDGLNAEYNHEANAQFIRNRFVCDIAMAMGYPAPHGRFVHLFLNGTYAGHYHLMERPDEHFFQAYIFEGADEDSIEVKKNDTYWNLPKPDPTFHQTLLSYSNGLSSKLNYQKLDDFINMDAAADYITLHQFIGSIDWHDEQNTLCGAIPTKGKGPFEFVVWDVDFSLGNKGVLSQGYEYNKHGAVPENIFNAAEFKFLQGDKVECLCKNGGILTPKKLKEKYLYRANQVEVSLIAEAARWGNHNYSFGGDFPDHKPIENWEVNTHWVAEFDKVYNDFLSNRTKSFIQKYIGLERYSTLQTVKISRVNNTIELKHENGFGTLIYMLNGEDPRTFGGELNPNALTYNNLPIQLNEPIEIKARFYKNTSTGRQWSNMCPKKFYPNQNYQHIFINELHINPLDQIVGSDTISGKHFEFVELKNKSNKKIFLQDVIFDDGITCLLEKGAIISAQGYFVLAADSVHFHKKYGFAPDATFTGKLNNGGDALRIKDPFGNIIDSLTYASIEPWPVLAELADQSIGLSQANLNNNNGANWQVQSVKYSPGEANKFCTENISVDASVTTPSCYGKDDGFIIPNINGGKPPYQYQWSNGSTTAQLTNLVAGNYDLIVNDKNGCTQNQSVILDEPNQLALNINKDNGLTANVSGGTPPYQYQWSNGETNASLQSALAGTYEITVSDDNGCTVSQSATQQALKPCDVVRNIKTSNLQAKRATVTWDTESNDLKYIIQYKKLSDSESTSVTQVSNTIILNNLEACTTYEVIITSICVENETGNSTPAFYFKTSGCLPCPDVQNLMHVNSTSASVSLSWDAEPDVSYLFYYKKQGESNWNIFETWINFVILFNLEACRIYQWKVVIKCGPENEGTPSQAKQFNTSGCKLNFDSTNVEAQINVYPNPVKKILHIKLEDMAKEKTNFTVKIFDSSGKKHFIKIESIDLKNETMRINVSNFKSGFYYLNLFNDNANLTKKIQVY